MTIEQLRKYGSVRLIKDTGASSRQCCHCKKWSWVILELYNEGCKENDCKDICAVCLDSLLSSDEAKETMGDDDILEKFESKGW